MPDKKDIARAYGKYAKQFTPPPKYISNSLKAFFCGGALCTLAQWLRGLLSELGASAEDATTLVTVLLIISAQLMTGFGIFDVIAQFAGAGVIVPITGFANSMVATAIEYKKEGPVLGIGANMFKVAGPVLVCGIAAGTLVGFVFWVLGKF